MSDAVILHGRTTPLKEKTVIELYQLYIADIWSGIIPTLKRKSDRVSIERSRCNVQI